MTSPTTPSYMPGASAPTGPTQPAPKNRLPWIVAGIAVLLAIVGGTAAVALAVGGNEPTAAPTTPAAAAPAAPVAEPTDLFPAVSAPTAKDFKLSVKILRKQCFGSAGCNIDYRIDVTYAGDPLALVEGRQYEVTYEVRGAEDPIVNSFTMDGPSASVDAEESTGTSSSSKKLTAVVTSVTEM